MAKLKIDESSKESIKTAHHEGSSIKDLAVKHNVSVSTISAIVRKPKEVTSNQSEDLLDKQNSSFILNTYIIIIQ